MNGQTTVKVQKVLELTAAFQTVHTVYTGRVLTVSKIHLVNTTAGAVTVQVCFVPEGGTPVQANALLWDYSLNAHTYVEVGRHLILPAKATIQALASAGNSVNIVFAGLEE